MAREPLMTLDEKLNPDWTALVCIDTDLALILRSRGVRTLINCGVTTNVCVESTTRHAYFLDYYCVVPENCVAAYGDGMHEMALRNIDLLFGEVTDSAHIVAALAASSPSRESAETRAASR